MREQDLARPSLDVIRFTAIQIYSGNDSYDDKKGFHPNTIKRSSEKAVEQLISNSLLRPIEWHAIISKDEPLRSIKPLREQGFTNDQVDGCIKKMLAVLICNSIYDNNPELVANQEQRLMRFGKI